MFQNKKKTLPKAQKFMDRSFYLLIDKVLKTPVLSRKEDSAIAIK
jgi:hypothetical protein